MTLRPMRIDDYEAVMELLSSTPGVVLRSADSAEAVACYLLRNPGLSFIAEENGKVIGCIMAGHDGRRGYLQHLAVAPAFRGGGIGRSLVEHCLAALQAEGIEKSHLDVLTNNNEAVAFWQHLGWQLRRDIFRFSFTASSDKNA